MDILPTLASIHHKCHFKWVTISNTFIHISSIFWFKLFSFVSIYGGFLLPSQACLPHRLQFYPLHWMVLSLSQFLFFRCQPHCFCMSLLKFVDLRRFQVLFTVLKTLKESGHENLYRAAEKPLLFSQTAAVLEVF